MDFLHGKKISYKDNASVSADVALKKKQLILYYFTSGGSEPCRNFDQKLKGVYYEAQDRNYDIGVIIVPADTSKEAYKKILEHYPEFFALHSDDNLIPLLTYNYGITHVPSLIVVRKNGEIVTKEGTKEIEDIGINVLVTWSE